LDTPVYLVIRPVRYKCAECEGNVTTAEVFDWVKKGSHVTNGLSDYILRQLIHSTIEDVSKKERISYKTIHIDLDKSIAPHVNWENYKALQTLGIDEIALKKGYQDFVTIISSKIGEDLSVLAVLKGRLKEDIAEFLRSIPEHLRSTIETVCTDMYDGYVSAVTEVLGTKVLVIDRYHVSKLYRKGLNSLRMSEMKRLKAILPAEEYQKLEGVMWILRKHHECLDQGDKDKLKLLYFYSPQLKKAHASALKLTQIFNTHCSKKSGLAKLNRWIQSVRKSGLTCFNRFIKTLEKYKTGIANYFKHRRNSGFVEGLNNLVKVVKRRCYGILKPESLFQRLFLDLQGFKLYA
jgi:transposase